MSRDQLTEGEWIVNELRRIANAMENMNSNLVAIRMHITGEKIKDFLDLEDDYMGPEVKNESSPKS